jgi:hypothetical protein
MSLDSDWVTKTTATSTTVKLLRVWISCQDGDVELAFVNDFNISLVNFSNVISNVGKSLVALYTFG